MDSFKGLEKLTDKLTAWLNSLVASLPNMVIALVVLVAAYYLSKFVYKLTLKFASNHISQKSISKLLSRIVSVFVVLIGLFLALSALNLGKALTGLLAGAGVSGLVIGLAMQGTLSNIVSGIVLAFRKNLRVGDWVETNSFSGVVLDINLSYFVLREADNNIVVMPNKVVLENAFKNYGLTPQMRISVECGVGYESNLDKVEEVTKATLKKFFPLKDSDKEVEFYYTEFGDSSINFVCRFWIEGINAMAKLKSKNTAIKEIKRAFDAEGFNIPFPIRTLQFDNNLNISKPNSSEGKD